VTMNIATNADPIVLRYVCRSALYSEWFIDAALNTPLAKAGRRIDSGQF
jgi:hypothetical protein